MRRGNARALHSLLLAASLAATAFPAAGNPSIKVIAALIAASVGWAETHPGQVPAGGDSYMFNAGVFDRVDRVDQTWSLGFERRWGGFAIWRLKPFVGAGITGRRSALFYAGLRLDLHPVPKLSVAPDFAVAGYLRGDGKDLGDPIEFRSGLDVEWRFSGGNSIGLGYHHLSHWIFFGSSNPGTEIITLTFSMPLR